MYRYSGLLIALLLGGLPSPLHAADRDALASPAFTARLVELINDYRRERGLPTLVVAEDLTAIASEHSDWMAGLRRLSHEGFRARFERAGSRVCVENLGWNFRQPESQLAGWLGSATHHRNLLDPAVTRVGIAVSRTYITFFACA